MRTVYAKLFLAVFLSEICLSCANDVIPPEQIIASKLSERFATNDYIDLAKLPTNPYEGVGVTVERLHQRFLAVPALSGTRSLIGRQLGITSEQVKVRLEAIMSDVLPKAGITYDQQLKDGFDRISKNLTKYYLTSESVNQYLTDAENDQKITSFEKQIIQLELVELTNARNNEQVRKICATAEYELMKSSSNPASISKLLMMNSVIRNVYENQLMSESGPLRISFDDTPRVEKAAVAWVAGALVVMAFIFIAEALSDPGCTTACQLTLTMSGMIGLWGGLQICEEGDASTGYLPCYQQMP